MRQPTARRTGIAGSIWLDPSPLCVGAPFKGRLDLQAGAPRKVQEVRLELRVQAKATVAGGRSETITLWASQLAGPGEFGGAAQSFDVRRRPAGAMAADHRDRSRPGRRAVPRGHRPGLGARSAPGPRRRRSARRRSCRRSGRLCRLPHTRATGIRRTLGSGDVSDRTAGQSDPDVATIESSPSVPTTRWTGRCQRSATDSPSRRVRAAASAAATRVGAVPPMTSHEASAPSIEAALRSASPIPGSVGEAGGRRVARRAEREADHRVADLVERRRRPPRPRPRASRRCGGRSGTRPRAGRARRRRPSRSCSPRPPPRPSGPRRR